MRPNSWQVILERELRERAEEHLHAILADLRAVPDVEDPSLAGGNAGLALLFGYLAASDSHTDAKTRGREHLDRAAHALAEVVLTPSLYSGFTGIAWAHAHLESSFYGQSDGDAAEEIDTAILQALGRVPWPHDYDLVNGLVGLGVYALERLPRPRAREALHAIVERLHDTSRSDPKGIYWHTAPHLLSPRSRALFPAGATNLGLAHGIPGVIALLAAIVAHGLAGERATHLLEGALDWIWAQRLPDAMAGCFAVDADGPSRAQPARLAWCYGDPGIAAAFSAASQVLDLPRLRELALRIGHTAASRDPDTSGVVDAGLCHGAAGLGHLFNRLFQASGEEAFLRAARMWFARTLELRREGEGYGGYRAWSMVGPEGDLGWRAEPGLLMGGAGIAAALLAATSSIPPTWDRFLLLSFPVPMASGHQTAEHEAHGSATPSQENS